MGPTHVKYKLVSLRLTSAVRSGSDGQESASTWGYWASTRHPLTSLSLSLSSRFPPPSPPHCKNFSGALTPQPPETTSSRWLKPESFGLQRIGELMLFMYLSKTLESETVRKIGQLWRASINNVISYDGPELGLQGEPLTRFALGMDDLLEEVSGVYDDRRSSSSAPDMNPILWPCQDEMIKRFNLNVSVPSKPVTDLNIPRMAPVSVHRDDGHTDNMVSLPCLKSMTWVMENKSSTPANRVAVINLKLQDYSRSTPQESEVKFQLSKVTLEPMLKSMAYISEQLSTANRVAVINLKLQDTETTSGESEVKFQVSRDTLGAMLRSMAYIREQLSNTVEPQVETPSKKQRK
nr:protein FAR1-RELATED SEQUENCE 3 isoform X1 [Ipomoea batatas]